MGKLGYGFGVSRRTTFAAEQLDTAASVTQHGVTFNFSQERPVGQYANGDWWVQGPVTITSVTPESAVVSGSYDGGGAFADRTTNGLVLNPGNRIYAVDGLIANNAGTIGQGWDSLDAESAPSQIAQYVETMNVDPAHTGQSLTVNEGTLVKAVSTQTPIPSAHPVLDDLVTLTVVITRPISDAIRPGYSRSRTTTRMRASHFDLSVFQNFAPTPNSPTFAEALASVDRLLEISTTTEPNARNAQPANHAAEGPYGREVGNQLNRAYLFLHLDVPESEKRAVLARLAAIADDLVAAAEEGKITPEQGGGNAWKKPQLAIVAAALGQNAPASLLEFTDFAKRDVWMVDNQIVTVDEEDVTTERAPDGRSRTPYEYGMVGATEWMEKGDISPEFGDANWIDGSDFTYRGTVYGPLIGGILATKLTSGAEALWNNPAIFDYYDTVFLRRNDTASDPVRTFVDEFAAAYWPQSNEIPAIQSAVLNNSEIALKFSIALDELDAPPAPGDFTVSVNGSSAPVIAVDIFRDTVGLTVGSAPLGEDTVEVRFTQGSNQLVSVYQVPAADFADFAVTNRNDIEAGPNAEYPVVNFDPATRHVVDTLGGGRTQGVTIALLGMTLNAPFANNARIIGAATGSPSINTWWRSDGIEVFLSDGGLRARIVIPFTVTIGASYDIIFSIDMTQASGAAGTQAFVNGVEVAAYDNFSWTQNGFINFDQVASIYINEPGEDFNIGAVWVDNQAVDLSIAGTRDKFTDPLQMGLNGDGITGSDPVTFLVGDAGQWNFAGGINRGTGTKFALDTGAVTTVSGTAWGTAAPPDGPVESIVVAGDSITVGGSYSNGWASANPAVATTVVAGNGRSLGTPTNLNDGGNSLYGRFSEMTSGSPDWITILIGANGMGGYATGVDYFNDLAAFTADIRALGIKVALSAVSPFDSRWVGGDHNAVNSLFEEFNTHLEASFTSIADGYIPLGLHPVFDPANDPNDGLSDGVHPNAAGNAAMASVFDAVMDPIAALSTATSPALGDWFGSDVADANTSTPFERRYIVTGLAPAHAAPFSHSGDGTLQKGFGAAAQGLTGTVRNGDVLTLRLTSSASAETAVAASVQIGDNSDTVSILTAAAVVSREEWNPADTYPGVVVENDGQDMTVSNNPGAHSGARGVIGKTSGKWFGEIEMIVNSNAPYVGVASENHNIALASHRAGRDNTEGAGWGANVFRDSSGNSAILSGASSNGSANLSSTAVVGIAVDADARRMWFYKDGVLVATGDPETATGGLVLPGTGALHLYATMQNSGGRLRINGGQRAFQNPLPSGYSPWGE